MRRLADRRVFCWAMYDWANSAYSTLIITVLITYVQRVVFPESDWGSTGPIVWAWGISLSMLLGAVLSPIVGAVADANGSKRKWLATTAFCGSAASIALGLISPNHYAFVVALFVLANLSLELSLGVYNGFLPEIAEESDINAVSAWGYGLGYLGGGIALVLAIMIIRFGAAIGLESTELKLRASLVLMGLWWGGFTIPSIWVLRDQHSTPQAKLSASELLRKSGAEVWSTIRSLRTNVPLALFLLSFLFYNDAMQTVISQSSTFALSELSLPESELMGVILMIQFVAMPGAIVIGRIADRIGKQPTLLGCLAVWTLTLLSALMITSSAGFWVLAFAIAIVLGGTQSVSRAFMTDLIPENQNAQYFGFFNLSGKATSFLGAFLFGAIIAATGSSRAAIIGLVPLFVIGAWLLSRIRQPIPCDD